ncbi:OsmC family protein [Demequina iriomotensis]|uniref:OsmC family protein n=1 Tax=Demequina iriomotensis TaxID=1536641 RepID=UPI000784F707|nr:OsmC family protein [Demequina iriomotensis]
MSAHTYTSTTTWSGRTSTYEGYDRAHEVTLAGGTLRMSADAAFRGDASLPNPEQLVVAAASSCQLLSFLAVAARAGVEVTRYDDEAEGVMPRTVRLGETGLRLTRIVLRPRIVARGASAARIAELVEQAHHECYIANSLLADVVVEPSIELA